MGRENRIFTLDGYSFILEVWNSIEFLVG